jgi:hypothetical protein
MSGNDDYKLQLMEAGSYLEFIWMQQFSRTEILLGDHIPKYDGSILSKAI